MTVDGIQPIFDGGLDRLALSLAGLQQFSQRLLEQFSSLAQERLVFSFMLNAYTGTATSGREVIDELAVLLANFSGRSE